MQVQRGVRRRGGAFVEREFFIDNLLVRIHFIILVIRWTGLAPCRSTGHGWDPSGPSTPLGLIRAHHSRTQGGSVERASCGDGVKFDATKVPGRS